MQQEVVEERLFSRDPGDKKVPKIFGQKKYYFLHFCSRRNVHFRCHTERKIQELETQQIHECMQKQEKFINIIRNKATLHLKTLKVFNNK